MPVDFGAGACVPLGSVGQKTRNVLVAGFFPLNALSPHNETNTNLEVCWTPEVSLLAGYMVLIYVYLSNPSKKNLFDWSSEPTGSLSWTAKNMQKNMLGAKATCWTGSHCSPQNKYIVAMKKMSIEYWIKSPGNWLDLSISDFSIYYIPDNVFQEYQTPTGMIFLHLIQPLLSDVSWETVQCFPK